MTGKELIAKLLTLSIEQLDFPVTYVESGWCDGRVLVTDVEVTKTSIYDKQDKDFDFDHLIQIS